MGTQKPPKTTKSSDRRLASGKRPEWFLHGTAKAAPKLAPGPWNPAHFRLFVGNLGPDATTDVLAAAFSAYASVTKVSVPCDAKGENRGYGFVAFALSADYLRAFKEMNGKYVGQRPVHLKRAELGAPKKKR